MQAANPRSARIESASYPSLTRRAVRIERRLDELDDDSTDQIRTLTDEEAARILKEHP